MRFMLAVAFFFCSLPNAAALRNASAQDSRDIADQISKKKAAEEEIKTKNQALNAARGDEALELGIRTEIARLKKVQKNAADQALWMTIRAYGIIPFEDNSPNLPKGISFLRSPEIGKEITWIPVFEDKRTFEIQDAAGNIVKTLKLDDAGNTASDGVSRLFPEAFISPVILASYIIHEKIHFEQFTDPLRGPVKTPGELEVEAYKTEQKLLNEGPLVFSAYERTLQEAYIAKNLRKRNAQVLHERAERAKGNPPLDVSIISRPKVEIDGLIQQAKNQIEIAQRDHDDRLRNTIKRLTQRSCANPGSVSQAELAALPRPYRADYWMSNGPGHCHGVYAYMAQGGTDAEYLRRMSTPLVPINPNPHIPAVPAPVQGISAPPAPFRNVLPDLKEFAIAACHAPEQVALEEYLYRPYDHSAGAYDGNAANLLATDLGICPKQLFKQLIATIRAGQGATIDRHWIRSKVADYTPGTGTSPGYVDPSPAPPNRGRRCEDFGVINCPKNLLQVKL